MLIINKIKQNQFLRIIYRIIRNQLIGLGIIRHKSGLKRNITKKIHYLNQAITLLFNTSSDETAFNNKTVMEIGPGNNIGSCFYLFSRGIRKYIGIDRFNSPDLDLDLYNYVLNNIDDTGKSNLNKSLNYSTGKLSSENIRIINQDIFSLDYTVIEPVDIIFSIYTLEHIKDLDKLFNIFNKLLKPSGEMYHLIGLQSHDANREKHELEFLTYSDWLWNLMTSNADFPNRLRFSDYIELLEKYSFKLKKVNIFEQFDEILIKENYNNFSNRFKKYSIEDLRPKYAAITAEKIL